MKTLGKISTMEVERQLSSEHFLTEQKRSVFICLLYNEKVINFEVVSYLILCKYNSLDFYASYIYTP